MKSGWLIYKNRALIWLWRVCLPYLQNRSPLSAPHPECCSLQIVISSLPKRWSALKVTKQFTQRSRLSQMCPQLGLEVIFHRTSPAKPGKAALAPLWAQVHTVWPQIPGTQALSPRKSTVWWLSMSPLKRKIFSRLPLKTEKPNYCLPLEKAGIKVELVQSCPHMWHHHYMIQTLVTAIYPGHCCCTQCTIPMDNSCSLHSFFSYRATQATYRGDPFYLTS